ncbi:MAG: C45 family autoproteolytic acyltransferase/hydrolase [Jatrophihabitans sp.]
MRSYSLAGRTAPRSGRHYARLCAAELPATIEVYRQLFAAAGLHPARVQELATGARAALRDWAPDLADCIDAIADEAGLPAWQLHALNARTELLSAAPAGRGECTALARPGLGGQTWDWHRELAGSWLVAGYPELPLPFITLTEAGMLAKIGVNAAGVGLLFTILGHRGDTGVAGVGVHTVARRVLDTATDVAAAIAIIASAPLSASSCFTVLDAHRVACVEASPLGVHEVPAEGGWCAHTNHFVSPALAGGELRTGPDTDTVQRLALLRHRLTAGPEVDSADQLRRLLCAHQADGAPICCHSDGAGPLGSNWQSLATVVLQPSAARLLVQAGGPCEASPAGWLIGQVGDAATS